MLVLLSKYIDSMLNKNENLYFQEVKQKKYRILYYSNNHSILSTMFLGPYLIFRTFYFLFLINYYSFATSKQISLPKIYRMIK
ncbi:unnamed protein product [Nezara viridula]|uniref:Uncharacterized protein n=1 Tax=Nezara viridula TaxID=85310 RepID=A0A9P0HU93_NEZVI|nr:unnamed protein product [Nezara viridula]